MSDSMKQIAMRIEDLRESSEYTVEQMAERLGVSVEEYRKYELGENDDMSISFLVKLSDVLGVDMTEILTGQTPRLNTLSVTRAGKGHETDSHDQYVYKNLAYNFIHRKIEPMYVTVRPEDNKTLVPNSHDGQEFDYILSGTMHLVVGKNDIILNPGDSAYYDSRAPHAMEAVGNEPVHFLAIVIP